VTIDQAFIAVFGVLAIWLANDIRPSWRRWGCVFGLCGQPFWFWSSWHAGQGGIFLLAFAFTAGWARGVWNQWVRP